MLAIKKIVSNCIVDYAAEELKKYLRMMMPEGGDISVSYDPDANDGFRLGLLSDFGLDCSDVEDPTLDDVIYIETDTRGGIISGANPRAILIAVYEYLRQNGCEWLMPGVDGEFIPMHPIVPVKYRHKPTMRHRGNCIEGAVSQQILEDFIDYMPKLGLNCFMIQFRNPFEFYRRHYEHYRNFERRPAEPVSKNTTAQWSVRLECEMAKRGIMFHYCGHGWTNDPFGIDSSLGWHKVDDSAIPEQFRDCIALVNGKRGFFRSPPNTQFCMSNVRARRLFVNYVADFCEKHNNTDYLHLWLADDMNNHCECEECRKKIASDWYVIVLNEIDAELTRRGIDTKILFIVYIDLTWAPLVEKFANSSRFIMMIAPISRDYTVSLGEPDPSLKMVPYVRNKLPIIGSLQEFMLYVEEWKKVWKGDIFAFEYHFWKHHQYDLSGLEIAARLYEDAKDYLDSGISGIMQCGSQRGFCPNGFAFYTHARTQFDLSVSLDSLAEHYYSVAYGEDWREFYDALKSFSDAVPYEYLAQPNAEKRPRVYHYPEMKPRIDSLIPLADKLLELIHSHYNSDYRVRTVMVRLLEYYCEYIKLLSVALGYKAIGENAKAREAYEQIEAYLGRREVEFEGYDDHLQKTGFIMRLMNLDAPEISSNSNGE